MRISSKIFGCLLLFGGVILYFTPAQAAATTSGVLNDRSNLRVAAGYTKVAAVLEKNTEVAIIDKAADWYHVKLTSGKEGWVISWLVDKVAPEKIADRKTAKLLYAARIRKTPAVTAGNIIETLLPGTRVQIVGSQGDWYSIKYASSKNGWVAKVLAVVDVADSKHSIATSSAGFKAAMLNVPNFISIEEINAYWQQKINALRQLKGLRELVIAPQLEQTAANWAQHLGAINSVTHLRPSGESAQSWIKDQGTIFTERNSPGGWQTNYFSENLGYRLNIPPTPAGVKAALDSVLQSYLKEGPAGSHFRSIYYPDWNSFGAGWYPIKNSNGAYTTYFVFHYGSLVL